MGAVPGAGTSVEIDMAAPRFVPTSPTHQPRSYRSPLRLRGAWMPDRPAEIPMGQPDADAGRMGAPGPDSGFVLKLLPVLRHKLVLTVGEEEAAVERGAVAIALKRASLIGPRTWKLPTRCGVSWIPKLRRSWSTNAAVVSKGFTTPLPIIPSCGPWPMRSPVRSWPWATTRSPRPTVRTGAPSSTCPEAPREAHPGVGSRADTDALRRCRPLGDLRVWDGRDRARRP